jgi:hypothetical protein
MLTLIKGGYHPSRRDIAKEVVNIDEIIELAGEFGLPLMVANGELIILGEERDVVFNIIDKNKAQLA